MRSKSDKKSMAALCGAVVTGLTASVAGAAENPFALKDLSSGYMVVAEEKQKEMACGEGKCGASMMKSGDMKSVEGKCAGQMKGAKETKPADSKSGEQKPQEGQGGAQPAK
jgi:uncharacterized low-complexity protein